MAYVDLHPMRAKMARRVEDTTHTSIARRLAVSDDMGAPLVSLTALAICLNDYRSLLEWTASIDAGGVAPPATDAARVLSRMDQGPSAWLGRVKAHSFKFRAYGALSLLHDYSERLRQRWLLGAKPGFAAPD